ncbi:Uncharacterised protein [Serratia fonticola]|uniref:Uncharacterized protein n=1 Tax=Serratia fonticola TaxID=47917 RepID=A0A4U9V695_SERFO|nr:Uncharacterised protein [Serratia fonticola]
MLRPGVQRRYFIHRTARVPVQLCIEQREACVPELALPGAHSDIVAVTTLTSTKPISLPVRSLKPCLFHTRFENASLISRPVSSSVRMDTWPAIALYCRHWRSTLIPGTTSGCQPTRYGMPQKRSGAAAVIERPTRNDWSRVVLRVMIDAAQDAGVVFDPILPKDDNLSLRADLNSLCEKQL